MVTPLAMTLVEGLFMAVCVFTVLVLAGALILIGYAARAEEREFARDREENR